MNIETLFNSRKIIPVVTIDRMEDCERIFGGLSDGGLLAADHQLAGTVVVGDPHAPQVRGRVAAFLEGRPVQIQHRHHGALPAGGGLFHGLSPEGHQLHSGGGVEHAGGVEGGILSQ